MFYNLEIYEKMGDQNRDTRKRENGLPEQTLFNRPVNGRGPETVNDGIQYSGPYSQKENRPYYRREQRFTDGKSEYKVFSYVK